VLDDEAEIADLVELFLKNEGYNVYKFYSSSEAIKCINSTPLDLALLDVMLPDTDGFTILRKIREEGFRFPVIMLTAFIYVISLIFKKKLHKVGNFRLIIKHKNIHNVFLLINRDTDYIHQAKIFVKYILRFS